MEVALAEGCEEGGEVFEWFLTVKNQKSVYAIENSSGTGWGGIYEKYLLRSPPAGVCVFLAQGDEFFGEALRFFGFGPGRFDGFVRYEGGDEVAEEGLAVRGAAV